MDNKTRLRRDRIRGFARGFGIVFCINAITYVSNGDMPVAVFVVANLPLSCCCFFGHWGGALGDDGDGGLSIMMPVAMFVGCCFWGWVGSLVAKHFPSKPASDPIDPTQTPDVGPPKEPDPPARLRFIHSTRRKVSIRPRIEPKPESDSLPR